MKSFSRLKAQFTPASDIKISSPSRGPVLSDTLCSLQALAEIKWSFMYTHLGHVFPVELDLPFAHQMKLSVARLRPIPLLNITPITRAYDNGMPIYHKDKRLLHRRRWLSIHCLSSCVMSSL